MVVAIQHSRSEAVNDGSLDNSRVMDGVVVYFRSHNLVLRIASMVIVGCMILTIDVDYNSIDVMDRMIWDLCQWLVELAVMALCLGSTKFVLDHFVELNLLDLCWYQSYSNENYLDKPMTWNETTKKKTVVVEDEKSR